MNQPETKTRKDFHRLFLAEALLVIKDILIVLATVIFFSFLYLYFRTPLGQNLVNREIPRTSIIYDRTGEHVLYELHGEEDRKIISHSEIPDVVRIATVAAEDDAFYSHHGIDLFAILRALKTNLSEGALNQGGSTITQQLARNAFLTREKTWRRKVMEIVLALKIENKYSKAEILDAYLNEVPYGSNAYGIEAAAENFFQKNAADLSLDEAALLAALPKATTYYSPYGANAERLSDRRDKILDRIAELGLMDAASISAAKKTDTMQKISRPLEKIEAPHFVFFVLDELEKRFGQKVVEEGGLKVYTSLDFAQQKTAENIIAESAGYNQSRYGATNAALVALDPRNGQILAMVGSKDYFDPAIDGKVNVTTRPRQPGSSFKPFAYATAFEKGYQPETLILDAATNFGPDGSGLPYIPRNYDGKFHGIVSMRQALAMSLNVPAVKTLRAVGLDDTIALAKRLGITTLNDRERYGLSLVIGGGEVTLLDETASFSVFANDGRRNPADPFLKIVDQNNKILYSNQPTNTPVLDAEVARKINSVLSDNSARTPIFGPNNKLHIPGKTVAAKTGTTQEFRDAWTVGYTPSIAVGVWAGNNDNRPMKAGADGSYVAAPIWNKFISQFIHDKPPESFLAYNPTADSPKMLEPGLFRITYYKKGSDKKMSPEKARKQNPQKVEMRIEIVSGAHSDRQITTRIDGNNLLNPANFDWGHVTQNY